MKTNMMHRLMRFVILLIPTLISGHAAAEQTPAPSLDDVKLADVIRFVRDATREVYGSVEAEKAVIEKDTEKLWLQVEALLRELYGTAETQARLKDVRRDFPNLEVQTFSILKELYGRRWLERYYPAQ